MQHSRQWQKSKLYRILESTALISSHLAIIQNYLGTDDCKYISTKLLAKQHGRSKQQLEELLDNYSLVMQNKNVENSMLESELQMVNLFLLDYKGAIEIDAWLEDSLKKYGFDQITALRYLRFAEFIQNKIYIDTKKMIFWDKRDRCIDCQKLQTEIEENYQCGNTEWENVIKVCRASDCPVKPDCKLNPGIVTYHMSVKENPELIKPRLPKLDLPRLNQPVLIPNQRIYDELKLSPNSITIFDFIVKNTPEISDAKLQAYGRIKNIDIFASLHEINDAYFAMQNRELLEFNNESKVWSVNIHCLKEEDNSNTCNVAEFHDDITENNEAPI